jgi:hypothetical protein
MLRFVAVRASSLTFSTGILTLAVWAQPKIDLVKSVSSPAVLGLQSYTPPLRAFLPGFLFGQCSIHRPLLFLIDHRVFPATAPSIL